MLNNDGISPKNRSHKGSLNFVRFFSKATKESYTNKEAEKKMFLSLVVYILIVLFLLSRRLKTMFRKKYI